MTKEDLLRRLEELGFDRKEYWVVSGGAMVLYGLREKTHDLDLGCTATLADRLENRGYPVTRLPGGGIGCGKPGSVDGQGKSLPEIDITQYLGAPGGKGLGAGVEGQLGGVALGQIPQIGTAGKIRHILGLQANAVQISV